MCQVATKNDQQLWIATATYLDTNHVYECSTRLLWNRSQRNEPVIRPNVHGKTISQENKFKVRGLRSLTLSQNLDRAQGILKSMVIFGRTRG